MGPGAASDSSISCETSLLFIRCPSPNGASPMSASVETGASAALVSPMVTSEAEWESLPLLWPTLPPGKARTFVSSLVEAEATTSAEFATTRTLAARLGPCWEVLPNRCPKTPAGVLHDGGRRIFPPLIFTEHSTTRPCGVYAAAAGNALLHWIFVSESLPLGGESKRRLFTAAFSLTSTTRCGGRHPGKTPPGPRFPRIGMVRYTPAGSHATDTSSGPLGTRFCDLCTFDLTSLRDAP
ncbi:hypothetical protein BGX38DRAFT_1173845 [Terfezia claveryi]|nr:hypothetical protein BGX38DRAFT_1173845 [Terfezia claveryi]